MYKITCLRAGGTHLNLKELNGEDKTIQIDEYKSIISEIPVKSTSILMCGILEPWIKYRKEDIVIRKIEVEKRPEKTSRTENIIEETPKKKEKKKIK